jgi:hypothetical protein
MVFLFLCVAGVGGTVVRAQAFAFAVYALAKNLSTILKKSEESRNLCVVPDFR